MKSILLFIFLLFPFVKVFSQEDSVYAGKMIIIFTNDGGEHIGNLISMDDREYYITTKKNGNVYIPKYTIKKIELITDENFVNNKYIEKNRFYPHYSISSNALSIKKGDIFLRTPFLLSAIAEVGINDRWAWSAGTFSIFAVGTVLRYNKPVSESNSLGFSAGYGGVMFMFPDADNSDKQIGYSRVYYTRGKAERNVTIGIGYASNFSGKIYSPFTTLGGMIRAGKGLVFLFEGMLLAEYKAGMMGATARMFTKKKRAIDFGFNLVMWEEKYSVYQSPLVYRRIRAFPLPALGYHIKF